MRMVLIIKCIFAALTPGGGGTSRTLQVEEATMNFSLEPVGYVRGGRVEAIQALLRSGVSVRAAGKCGMQAPTPGPSRRSCAPRQRQPSGAGGRRNTALRLSLALRWVTHIC